MIAGKQKGGTMARWAKRARRVRVAASMLALATVAAMLASCGGSTHPGAAKGTAKGASSPGNGGALTVLEGAALVGSYPNGLDLPVRGLRWHPPVGVGR